MSQTFIISRHNADRAGLHDDLYLEDSGHFLAWAIPKLFPIERGVKRLAVKVADHSPRGAMFEGKIVEGYGKGTKEIWDEGTYIPYHYIVAPKPIRIDFFGDKIVGSYYLKQWQGNQWLIWRT